MSRKRPAFRWLYQQLYWYVNFHRWASYVLAQLSIIHDESRLIIASRVRLLKLCVNCRLFFSAHGVRYWTTGEMFNILKRRFNANTARRLTKRRRRITGDRSCDDGHWQRNKRVSCWGRGPGGLMKRTLGRRTSPGRPPRWHMRRIRQPGVAGLLAVAWSAVHASRTMKETTQDVAWTQVWRMTPPKQPGFPYQWRRYDTGRSMMEKSDSRHDV